MIKKFLTPSLSRYGGASLETQPPARRAYAPEGGHGEEQYKKKERMHAQNVCGVAQMNEKSELISFIL